MFYVQENFILFLKCQNGIFPAKIGINIFKIYKTLIKLLFEYNCALNNLQNL